MKLYKLNQRGISHIILPMAFVLVVGLIGVKVLTASHADQIDLTTSSSSNVGNNVAWEGPLNSSASSSQIVQSSVSYTLLGYQQVVDLAPGQQLSYINGIKGNVQACFDVFVQQPKSGTVTATISIANNNNVATHSLVSTTNDNLKRICVGPGSATNPGYSIKNTTPTTQTTNIEVVDEQLRW